MAPAVFPLDEAARIDALRDYDILDSPAEVELDKIAKLAAYVCGTPSALISLIDVDRQWFKARFAFGPTETHRDFSFCAHTILGREVMMVPDTTLDPRFRTNPFVVGEPWIRFYAGAPLISPQHVALGALAVLDYVPRTLDVEQQAALSLLSDQVVARLELRRRLLRERRAVEERAARALDDSESQKLAIVEASLDCIIVIDQRGVISEFNPAAEQTFGYSRSQVLGRELADVIIPPGLRSSHRRGLAHYLATGEGRMLNRRIETRGLHADGRELPIELTVARLGNATPAKFVGFLRDLTAREHDQRALHDSVERFELVSRATNDAVWDWDIRTNALWWNAGFEQLFGYHRDEIEPSLASWTNRIHPDDLTRVKTGLQRAIEEPGGATWSDEYRFRRRDGSYAEIFDRGYVMRDPDGTPVRMIGAMMDITERKRAQEHARFAEEQLRQSQKMDALGQLSGGVAHDFNNLLTVIQINASLVSDGRDVAEIKEHASEIRLAAERAASLTRQLLLVSRKQVMQPTSFDLNTVARDMVKMLHRIVGEDIDLQTVYQEPLPLLRGDVGMIEQVLLNLVVNARDAMPNGGRLTVRTSLRTLDEADARTNPEARSGPCIGLTVSDTGVGIAPDVLPHVFEPFFTTKAVGRGTGLGLATVYGIVRQHDGWIMIRSEPGTGTAVEVTLPVTEHVQPTPSRPRTSERSIGGSETVLVVEDEQVVRQLVVGVLRRHGYTVLEAHSGVAALAVWQEHQDGIDVVLTDLVMPDGMNGLELAERLRRDRPDLKVLYTSGYTAELACTGAPLVDGINFLQKPYSPIQLAQTLRQLIDRDG